MRLSRLELIGAVVCRMALKGVGQGSDRALGDSKRTLENLLANGFCGLVRGNFLVLLTQLVLRVTLQEPRMVNEEKCLANTATSARLDTSQLTPYE